MTVALTNWAGNVSFRARRVHRPASVDELRGLVAASPGPLRPLGTTHSFNRIADCDGELVSVADLPPAITPGPGPPEVTVAAGVRYGELSRWLAERGLALRNLGSLPHISVAGACATGTHGSGDGNGVLATSVSAVELVTADGELRTFRTGDPEFPGVVVGLGAFGVVTRLTLACVPTFDVRQQVFEGLALEEFVGDVAGVFGAGYSVSVFTDWHTDPFGRVWVKQRAEDEPPAPGWRGTTPATAQRNAIAGMTGENCTQQLGVVGPWHERLPHFRLEFVPSAGDELQSEYFVPREHAAAAVEALHGIGARLAPVLLVSELRTIAADALWLSPACGRDSVAFHFTWLRDEARVTPVLGAIEQALEPFGARPHWGKLFTTPPERLRELFPRLPDFQRLRATLDPANKFGNAFLDAHVPADRS